MATQCIRVLDLAAESGQALPPFEAGAHIEVAVRLENGAWARRAYSLADDPVRTDQYRIGVLRKAAGRGGSAYIHDGLKEGDVLTADSPKNQFPLLPSGRRHVLIAGGIGITPILAMAYALHAQARRFELHYCARSMERMAFRAELEAFCGESLRVYLDDGDPRRGIDLETVLEHPQPDDHVYVCGPRGLIEAAYATARRRGWDETAVHSESFAPPAPRGHDRVFEVQLARSGRSFQVPADRSILDVLLAAGIDADHDCLRGECGACAVRVLSGTPEHRDFYLNVHERNSGKIICPCVSRARSEFLLLDL